MLFRSAGQEVRLVFGIGQGGEGGGEAQADALATLRARVGAVHQGGPEDQRRLALLDAAAVTTGFEAGVELPEGGVEGHRVDRKVDRFRRQARSV